MSLSVRYELSLRSSCSISRRSIKPCPASWPSISLSNTTMRFLRIVSRCSIPSPPFDFRQNTAEGNSRSIASRAINLFRPPPSHSHDGTLRQASTHGCDKSGNAPFIKSDREKQLTLYKLTYKIGRTKVRLQVK